MHGMLHTSFPVQNSTDSMRKFWLLLLVVFNYGFPLKGIGTHVSRPPRDVNIGAVISFNSTIGKVAKLAIEAAVNDINSNPTLLNTTALRISLKDTKVSTGLPGILESLLLMENETVAIVGPQNSVMAHVISQIATELHVPLLSFGATDPTLSSLQFPYFVRTTQSDLSQMAAVAEIVNYYQWTDVIAIFIDDDHGRNGIASLENKRAEKRCKISNKAPLKPNLTQDEIINLLFNVTSMQSRVIVLHIHPEFGLEVLNLAHSHGMLVYGYVWIATDWLSTILDTDQSLYTSSLNNIQGVITFRMYTPDSRAKMDFYSNWSNLTNEKAPFGLNSYGLYAYDSVWVLAYALDEFCSKGGSLSFTNDSSLSMLLSGNSRWRHLADSIKVFSNGKDLLKNILEVNQTGLTGQMTFNSERNLVNSAYEVFNVVGNGMRRIGYWSSSYGLTIAPPDKLQNANSSGELYGVIWPGQRTETPHGWVFSSNGRILRIGVQLKVDYNEFVRKVEGSEMFSGYCIEVFNAALHLLPYHVEYNFIEFDNDFTSLEDMLHMITTGELDVVVGDIAITTDRAKIVDFTQPIIESGLVVVAPIKESKSNAWAFLRPFTPMMWFVIMMFFFVVGTSMWVLERRTNDDFQGPPRRQFVTIIWFSFSTLFLSQREKTLSALGRFVLIIWLFVALILNSSYTASLTSILTVEQLYSSVKGIDSLVTSNDPIGYQKGSFVEKYLTQELNVRESRLIALKSSSEYEKALKDGPTNGGVAAIVAQRAHMEVFLSTRCDFGIVGHEFINMGWGFAFPRESPLAVDMSTGIVRLSENGHLQRIYEKWFAKTACSSEGAKQDIDKLELKSFWGLFLLCGAACLVALLCYVFWMANNFNKHGGHSSENSSFSSRCRSFLSFVNEKQSKEGKKKADKSSSSSSPVTDEHDGSDVGVFIENNEPMSDGLDVGVFNNNNEPMSDGSDVGVFIHNNEPMSD